MNEKCSFEIKISAEDVLAFAKLSGDHNPLHSNMSYAKNTEFGRPIVHGAFLVGIVSRVLGMEIPGEKSLILSMRISFPKPLFYPSTIRVDGQLKFFDEEKKMGLVQITIVDLAKSWIVLSGQVNFALHASVDLPVPKESIEEKPHLNEEKTRLTQQGMRKKLLMTGGTGGVGSQVLEDLSKNYDICCLTRKFVQAKKTSGVEYEEIDLEDTASLLSFLNEINPSDFYGILHLSTPPIPRNFVSDDIEAVRQHLYHSVEMPLLLVKWARQKDSCIKRIILMGSTSGSKSPQPRMGAYSLAKGSMEHLIKLLPMDLASLGATINMIAPTVIPVGLNEGMPERARKMLAGKMPTGRLVESFDVAHVACFLLSAASSQINGTIMTVDGGILDS